MGYKVVIADDEAPAREELAYLTGQIPDVLSVVTASGGMEAVRRVQEEQPDLLFLDMDMPDLSGRQVAQLLAELQPGLKIVFSTAYDQYAVDAFKLRAFHYLLKPYDEEEVAEVFRELRKAAVPVTPKPAAAGGGCVKLALEVEGGIKYVFPAEVQYISKEGKHVLVHTGGGAYPVGYTLQELEQKLAPYGFFRCHKSYLVRLAAITELKSWINGAYDVRIDDEAGTTVPVSRNYVKELRLKLEI
ncbi:two-component response regulator [Paenibacillus mucilaginosus 3016]|uniref:Two-component response regulator n=2 Tax=Paenibacillus mucilaginosus TaxID=61624 RepID=H6NDZ0_9BACL|nr:LytTR family DNA-binding domain-containing protein [Paenibacillus mucilaginosus]AFC32943.1 two-component response regulator [Paenibacillus mucilaginosus 3016]AFH65254.1 regulator [Paenibacillus mucilaginosus K02]WFA21392.1 response regulator transcription factor [Paenibacillus mucilaginosus]